jgi:hypothetical protein
MVEHQDCRRVVEEEVPSLAVAFDVHLGERPDE